MEATTEPQKRFEEEIANRTSEVREKWSGDKLVECRVIEECHFNQKEICIIWHLGMYHYTDIKCYAKKKSKVNVVVKMHMLKICRITRI